MTNMRDIQPEAFEFQPETSADEIGFDIRDLRRRV